MTHTCPKGTLLTTETVAGAKDYITTKDIGIVISGYVMPDVNALDFMAFLKEENVDVPVLITTAKGDELLASELLHEGAEAYIPLSHLTQDILDRNLEKVLTKTMMDKEAKRAFNNIKDGAMMDELTGLYNRRYVNDMLDRELESAKRYKKNRFESQL